MGKSSAKKKRNLDSKSTVSGSKPVNYGLISPRSLDMDTIVVIEKSRELKEEGDRHFQRREYDAAIMSYEKAVEQLPKKHLDIAHLRSNLATCYMQLNPGDYHQAIKECNLALEVSPKYTKALLKRARCFEALNRLEWALKDVSLVLNIEPHNLTALEISDRVKKELEKSGNQPDNQFCVPCRESLVVSEKDKSRKKRGSKVAINKASTLEVKHVDNKKENTQNIVKLILGDDIRLAQLPSHCSILKLREIVQNRFLETEAVQIKYKDTEGDLVTITTTEDLRLAEEASDPHGSFKLYIVEVNPEKDPLFLEKTRRDIDSLNSDKASNGGVGSGNSKSSGELSGASYMDNWIVDFACLFRNHVGFDSDEYIDLHEIGVRMYSEALEEVVTSEEAQELFNIAEEKFHEKAALAMFNWGNVHMSRARKRLFLSGDSSEESILSQVKDCFEWSQKEYVKAGNRYEEALRIKPDFYEGLLALGQQQFEQAKLCWYYAIGNQVDLQTWSSTEVLELFNNAEDNMERGTEMWEQIEEHRLKNLSKPNKEKELLHKMGLGHLHKEISIDEAAERVSNMRSQINLLWGTMLYERSVVEFKIGMPIWTECLIVSVEKFKLAGASPTDIAVMIKNHCSDETAQEGLGFKIDEIVQAWSEMYDAKRWQNDVPSFRLEPLFRRPVPKLHHMLEHM